MEIEGSVKAGETTWWRISEAGYDAAYACGCQWKGNRASCVDTRRLWSIICGARSHGWSETISVRVKAVSVLKMLIVKCTPVRECFCHLLDSHLYDLMKVMPLCLRHRSLLNLRLKHSMCPPDYVPFSPQSERSIANHIEYICKTAADRSTAPFSRSRSVLHLHPQR